MIHLTPELVFSLSLAILALAVLPLVHIAFRRHRRQQLARHQHQLALLRHLIAGLQKHRGLSQGVLNGDPSLATELQHTRHQLDQCFGATRGLDTDHGDRWEALLNHWSRLRARQTRDADDNLRQHHQLIRNSLMLLEDVATAMDLTLGRPELSYLPRIWHEVMQAAEWSGQARALGTGMAATGASTPAQRVRLRFLHGKIEMLTWTAMKSLREHEAAQTEHPLSDALSRVDPAVSNLLNCIESRLLQTEQPALDARQYFHLATRAVDELLGLVDAALAHLETTAARP
ncbi:hypothetical protein E4656_07300 [Natronospirillum operosum]|uniref:Nitrate/nitrite sensing protein domain-containing protein n=1 Tax=Natronospirillum operosum TaxID=2759953 RepID=A0A4Z0W9X1_9GAMM|nr:nitrate- and nitrite sensing domain-containing protein [Natronospirillum operosum]TGG93979.1 hypothetical protein E4656_07300 [Natronospirillum operosum]